MPHFSLSANPVEAQEFLKKAMSKGKPKYIQTDAGVFYPKVFRKLFYSNKIGGLNFSRFKMGSYTPIW